MVCSHDGKKRTAMMIAKKASEIGADIIQLQIWKLQNLVSPLNPNYKRILKLNKNMNG